MMPCPHLRLAGVFILIATVSTWYNIWVLKYRFKSTNRFELKTNLNKKCVKMVRIINCDLYLNTVTTFLAPNTWLGTYLFIN